MTAFTFSRPQFGLTEKVLDPVGTKKGKDILLVLKKNFLDSMVPEIQERTAASL